MIKIDRSNDWLEWCRDGYMHGDLSASAFRTAKTLLYHATDGWVLLNPAMMQRLDWVLLDEGLRYVSELQNRGYLARGHRVRLDVLARRAA